MTTLFTTRTNHGRSPLFGRLWSSRRLAEAEAALNGEHWRVVELVEKPALNPKAVEALVRFFQQADTCWASAHEFNHLAESLSIDPTADRDTLEMGIRHALTKEPS